MSSEQLNNVIHALEAGNPPPPDAGFLGANLSPDAAGLVVIPVPWDVTASYGVGASAAPEAIRKASHQLDLEDEFFGRPYSQGITLLPVDSEILRLNRQTRPLAERAISALATGSRAADETRQVNQASEQVMSKVYATASRWLRQGKRVGLVGGDHSSPFGLVKALAEASPGGFGILQIDAHHDFRRAYEGFAWSHASIAFNFMEQLGDAVSRLIQVGVRDYSREEAHYLQSLAPRARCFRDSELFASKAAGVPFARMAESILADLPDRVYVSFDIDGLEPQYCPGTGTPVPGGLTYSEAVFLLRELVRCGKQVIGFDLCEVAPRSGDGEWNANVGARILYSLCGATLAGETK